MVVAGRRKSIVLFIALGTGLILVTLLLYIGWVLLNWRTGILLFLGLLLLGMIIAGVVLNTIFLVREIRRNEQQDAFINAVTHELKTPVASIRLYLETLQTRPVDEEKRQEFYRIMLEDSDRLLATIEQILRTGRIGVSSRKLESGADRFAAAGGGVRGRARAPYTGSRRTLIEFRPGPPLTVRGDMDEVRAAVSNLIDNAVKYSGREVRVIVEVQREDGHATVRVRDEGPGIPKTELKQIFKRFYRVPGPLASSVKGHRPGAVHRALGGQAARRTRVGGKRRAGAGQHVRTAITGG